ncbi:MAG: DUF6588 family protein, partial [Eudoraea sp.]|nr:DUF6588 family protein [Eudoraea sp.]
MKRILFFLCVGFSAFSFAQSNVNELFAAGLEDTERFMNDYLAPVSEAA